MVDEDAESKFTEDQMMKIMATFEEDSEAIIKEVMREKEELMESDSEDKERKIEMLHEYYDQMIDNSDSLLREWNRISKSNEALDNLLKKVEVNYKHLYRISNFIQLKVETCRRFYRLWEQYKNSNFRDK